MLAPTAVTMKVARDEDEAIVKHSNKYLAQGYAEDEGTRRTETGGAKRELDRARI